MDVWVWILIGAVIGVVVGVGINLLRASSRTSREHEEEDIQRMSEGR